MNNLLKKIKSADRKNLIPRLLTVLLFAIPLIFYKEFYKSFIIYLPNDTFINSFRNQWHLVIINIIFFMLFLIPLSYRRKTNWTEYGLVTAFFISLFIEMYGIPLSLLFMSKYLDVHTAVPPVLFSFNMFGVELSLDICMLYGGIIMTIGMIIITIGWITLYRNIKGKGLVTSGIYSFSRHPQYAGFILIIVGWFFGWPTLLTIILSPILIYKYIRVCILEEKEVAKEFPEYSEYKKKVPFFI